MKSVCVGRVLIFAGILFAAFFCLAGCAAHGLGETKAEGHRRHLRQFSLQRQMIMDDIDAVLLLDRPSRLAERRIR